MHIHLNTQALLHCTSSLAEDVSPCPRRRLKFGLSRPDGLGQAGKRIPLSKNKVILPALAGASRPASPDSKDWDKLAKEYDVFLAKNMVSEEDLNVHVDEGYEALEALIQGLNSSTALPNEGKLKVSLRQAPRSYSRIAPPPARVPGHRPIATPLPSP